MNNQVFPAFHAINDRLGVKGHAMTNAGHLVLVWAPYPANAANDKLFCHGLSLGTYDAYSYSVFGDHVQTVLNDEYMQITNLNAVQPGDVVVFKNTTQPAAFQIVHTAIFMNMIHNQDQTVSDQSIVRGKNVFAAGHDVTFAAELAQFPQVNLTLYYRRTGHL